MTLGYLCLVKKHLYTIVSRDEIFGGMCEVKALTPTSINKFLLLLFILLLLCFRISENDALYARLPS